MTLVVWCRILEDLLYVSMTESEKKSGEDDPVSSEWWAEHLSEGDKYNLEVSGKMVLLYEILKMSENIGDKV